MTNDMNLGTTETFEVWFLPDNRVSYSPRLIIDANSLQEATEFVAERLPDMAGNLEVVRVTTTRHLVAPLQQLSHDQTPPHQHRTGRHLHRSQRSFLARSVPVEAVT